MEAMYYLFSKTNIKNLWEIGEETKGLFIAIGYYKLFIQILESRIGKIFQWGQSLRFPNRFALGISLRFPNRFALGISLRSTFQP